jgi:hypothetical protein
MNVYLDKCKFLKGNYAFAYLCVTCSLGLKVLLCFPFTTNMNLNRQSESRNDNGDPMVAFRHSYDKKGPTSVPA